MAVKDHIKYLAEIDVMANLLENVVSCGCSKVAQSDSFDYFKHTFTRRVNDDKKVSTSDKVHLIQKLIDKLNAVLLK